MRDIFGVPWCIRNGCRLSEILDPRYELFGFGDLRILLKRAGQRLVGCQSETADVVLVLPDGADRIVSIQFRSVRATCLINLQNHFGCHIGVI